MISFENDVWPFLESVETTFAESDFSWSPCHMREYIDVESDFLNLYAHAWILYELRQYGYQVDISRSRDHLCFIIWRQPRAFYGF